MNLKTLLFTSLMTITLSQQAFILREYATKEELEQKLYAAIEQENAVKYNIKAFNEDERETLIAQTTFRSFLLDSLLTCMSDNNVKKLSKNSHCYLNQFKNIRKDWQNDKANTILHEQLVYIGENDLKHYHPIN